MCQAQESSVVCEPQECGVSGTGTKCVYEPQECGVSGTGTSVV